MPRGCDGDDPRTSLLGELNCEVPHPARGAVDKDPFARERDWPVPIWLQAIRFVVTQVDQELPRGQARHRSGCGVNVIDRVRFEGKIR